MWVGSSACRVVVICAVPCLLAECAHAFIFPPPSSPQLGSRDPRKPPFHRPLIMAWYSDWSARCDRIVQLGLPVLVRDINIDPATGFIAVHF